MGNVRGHASEFSESVKSTPVVRRAVAVFRATTRCQSLPQLPQQLSRAENNMEFNLYTCKYRRESMWIPWQGGLSHSIEVERAQWPVNQF